MLTRHVVLTHHFQGIWGQQPCFNYNPGTCDITFKDSQPTYGNGAYPKNIRQLTLPAVSKFAGVPIPLHDPDANFLVDAKTGERLTNCQVTGVVTGVAYVACAQDLQYRNVDCELQNAYANLKSFASAPANADAVPTMSLNAQFTVTAAGAVAAAPIAAATAVSLYSALSGTATVLSMSCDAVAAAGGGAALRVDSCLMFEAVPTNESPDLVKQAATTDLNIKYRFSDPPVATLRFNNVTDGTDKSTDTMLNADNPIVTQLGTAPAYCNDEDAEYQGEDGAWYRYFRGSDGHYVNMTHIVYVDAAYAYSSTMQSIQQLPLLKNGIVYVDAAYAYASTMQVRESCVALLRRDGEASREYTMCAVNRYFRGSDDHYVNTTHIVYVDAAYAYASTMQIPWQPLYDVVTARNLRMRVACYNEVGWNLGDGYLYFASAYGAPLAAAMTVACAPGSWSDAFCGKLLPAGAVADETGSSGAASQRVGHAVAAAAAAAAARA
ncbi:hypothetical protein JKP88DRAFT_274566 [Tribonema minus]|uniref:Uncharacterized protein n=1 Tax=Tribonema minus TaxID=303371 RepID=A0A836C858_9STRA|nr:hypothetical protein JKP88DRAFT_274566 [Tribonema minus]